jgi:sulfide:quinone oxidoreductase
MSARRDRPLEVLVAGGGVAAAEAVVALRALAGRRVRLALLAPDPLLRPSQLAVGVPFGFGAPAPLALDELAQRFDLTLHDAGLTAVFPDSRVALDSRGRRHAYDVLLVAVGARPRRALTGALLFRGPADAAALAAVLDELAAGAARRLVFAVPAGVSWALPLYELATMAAVDLRDRAAPDARVCVLTPEPEPLALFGAPAGDAVRTLLEERGVALRTGVRPVGVRPGGVELADGSVEPPTASSRCRRWSAPRSPACPPTRTASCRSTSSGAWPAWTACSPPATRRASPSSRAGSPPSRRTPRRARSRRWPARP